MRSTFDLPDSLVKLPAGHAMAVLRLLTNRVAMNGAPTTPEVALNAWQILGADPRSVQMRGSHHWLDHSTMHS